MSISNLRLLFLFLIASHLTPFTIGQTISTSTSVQPASNTPKTEENILDSLFNFGQLTVKNIIDRILPNVNTHGHPVEFAPNVDPRPNLNFGGNLGPNSFTGGNPRFVNPGGPGGFPNPNPNPGPNPGFSNPNPNIGGSLNFGGNPIGLKPEDTSNAWMGKLAQLIPNQIVGGRLLNCPDCQLVNLDKLSGNWRLIYASDNFIKLHLQSMVKMTSSSDTPRAGGSSPNVLGVSMQDLLSPMRLPVCVKWQVGVPSNEFVAPTVQMQYALRTGTVHGSLRVGYGSIQTSDAEDASFALMLDGGRYPIKFCVISSNFLDQPPLNSTTQPSEAIIQNGTMFSDGEEVGTTTASAAEDAATSASPGNITAGEGTVSSSTMESGESTSSTMKAHEQDDEAEGEQGAFPSSGTVSIASPSISTSTSTSKSNRNTTEPSNEESQEQEADANTTVSIQRGAVSSSTPVEGVDAGTNSTTTVATTQSDQDNSVQGTNSSSSAIEERSVIEATFKGPSLVETQLARSYGAAALGTVSLLKPVSGTISSSNGASGAAPLGNIVSNGPESPPAGTISKPSPNQGTISVAQTPTPTPIPSPSPNVQQPPPDTLIHRLNRRSATPSPRPIRDDPPQGPYYMILSESGAISSCQNFMVLATDEQAYFREQDDDVKQQLALLAADTDANPLQYIGCPCRYNPF